MDKRKDTAPDQHKGVKKFLAAGAAVVAATTLYLGIEASNKDTVSIKHGNLPAANILPSREDIGADMDETLRGLPDRSAQLEYLASRGCAAYTAYANGQFPLFVEGERPLVNTIEAASVRYDSLQNQELVSGYASTFDQEARMRCEGSLPPPRGFEG